MFMRVIWSRKQRVRAPRQAVVMLKAFISAQKLVQSTTGLVTGIRLCDSARLISASSVL